MTWLYVLTLYFYRRLADIIYVPSLGLGKLVGGKNVRLLPPGGYGPSRPHKPSQQPQRWVLYVGGGGPYDGVDLLVSAMSQVYHTLPDVRLALIMRRSEWPRTPLAPYITLVEAHGPALEPWYEKATVAVIPRKDTAYTRLAWPVKLMDYLSHGLGVIVTDRSEAARFVEHYQVGQTCRPDSVDLAQTLERCLQSPGLLDQYAENACLAIVKEHSWDCRAKTLLNELLPLVGSKGQNLLQNL